MIDQLQIDEAYRELKSSCGGVREDYFGLLYLEQQHKVPRTRAVDHVTFNGHDYGVDGFYFDEPRRTLYLFQFKYSDHCAPFKASLQRLIDKGFERIFIAPNKDPAKNQILMQLRSCLLENRSLIDQICLRFVFTGDPEEAERSEVLGRLREDLEDKRYLVDRFFGDRKVGLAVEFRSSAGRIGLVREVRQATAYEATLTDRVSIKGPSGQIMHVGFLRLADLHGIYMELGHRFFDGNIRYGLGESKAVNRAISKALKDIILDGRETPEAFAFHHNGITIHAQQAELEQELCRLHVPRVLNGAQTVTTVAEFLKKHDGNPKLAAGKNAYESIRVLCKVITGADDTFVTRVTVNNNRQNPVEPWNLRANDRIQLELQDKFREELRIYYERQENAFDQFSTEDLTDRGIREQSKAIELLKLTQTFLLTDGNISRVSDMRRTFEEDGPYEKVFSTSRLRADAREILLCYKAQFRLRKAAEAIEQMGHNKYAFIQRSRSLLWALLCQGLLNDSKIAEYRESFGKSLVVTTQYKETLNDLATRRVRPLLSDLIEHPDYRDKAAAGNLSFLRSDRAFESCMEFARTKWNWSHKRLV